jgi:tRNA pseudouridine55 synthase
VSVPRGTDDARSRSLDGVLLLDKPAGITSHTAVARAKRLFHAAKAGHTGTLDPLATGLLPVCFGEATKFSHLLLDADKAYLATVRLGMTTTTGDLEGAVVSEQPVTASRDEVEVVLGRFVGELMQTPPMYSAIKQGGQPLHKLARQGRELPRAPRRIAIRSLVLSSLEGDTLELSVVCSKGTYIRVLAEDVGAALGCGGCLAGLRRTGAGHFQLAQAATFEHIESLTPGGREGLLLPPDALVASLPRYELDAEQARRLCHGQALGAAGTYLPGLTRIYGPEREFIGVAEFTADGRIIPRRLKAQTESADPIIA